MPLKIETFKNQGWRPGGNFGGTSLFKALGHPYAAECSQTMLQRLQQAGPIAVYDPLGQASDFEVLYSLGGCQVTSAFVQDIDDIGTTVAGCEAQLVTELHGINPVSDGLRRRPPCGPRPPPASGGHEGRNA